MTVHSATIAAGLMVAPLPLAACLGLACWALLQRLAWRLVRDSLASITRAGAGPA
jgi:hypothetical protein